MTDLHCHILPGIDDGAQTLEDAQKLLQLEEQDGVEQILFTPHFDCVTEDREHFLVDCRNALEMLRREACLPPQMVCQTAAEIAYAPMLPSMDLQPLSFGRGKNLLIELPYMRLPEEAEYTLFSLAAAGYQIILAHVERYAYLRENPKMLYHWVDNGILTQVNAASILSRGSTSGWVSKLIGWDMVHMLASDAHSAAHRPPRQKAGYIKITEVFGAETAARFVRNADAVFRGISPEPQPEPVMPRRFLGVWR